MTMTHHSQDGLELQHDERTTDREPTRPRPRGHARRWSVAQLIAAAHAASDHAAGA